MKIIITGSQGTIGTRLTPHFPEKIGIDIKPGADIRANLEFIDYEDRDVRRAFETANALIHLATTADTTAPADRHWQDVVNTSRLLEAARARGIKTLVVASSDLAMPDNEDDLTTFGHGKRVLEIMTAMYDHEPGYHARPVRVGWVPREPGDMQTTDEKLRARIWSDKRLVSAFKKALTQPPSATAPSQKETVKTETNKTPNSDAPSSKTENSKVAKPEG